MLSILLLLDNMKPTKVITFSNFFIHLTFFNYHLARNSCRRHFKIITYGFIFKLNNTSNKILDMIILTFPLQIFTVAYQLVCRHSENQYSENQQNSDSRNQLVSFEIDVSQSIHVGFESQNLRKSVFH